MDTSELRLVLREQQTEALRLRKLTRPREKILELQELVRSSKLVKVVMGIRRAGKSMLCLEAVQEDAAVSYVNFDDERLVGLTRQDLAKVYELLLEINPDAKVFIFDEIQNVESWELFINRLQRKQVNLLITGSNGSLLSKELASHLTGRQVSIELFPLSFAEYLIFNSFGETDPSSTEARAGLKQHFTNYFEKGGFPDVVLGEPQGYYLRELFDKIVSRDIIQRYGLRRSVTLKELALYVIQQSGSNTSLLNLQETFSLPSVNTVRTYLQYLQEVYLIYEVQGYSSKLKERSTRPKKYYACDTGLWSALNTKPTFDLGMRLETLVFLHLRRRNQSIFYLKDQRFDVDFCIVQNRKPTELIQVCYNMMSGKTRDRELRSLVAAAKSFRLDVGTVITWDEDKIIELDGVRIAVIPAWRYFLSNERASS
jgi:predicted AAA+ superfamily ATPase